MIELEWSEAARHTYIRDIGDFQQEADLAGCVESCPGLVGRRGRRTQVPLITPGILKYDDPWRRVTCGGAGETGGPRKVDFLVCARSKGENRRISAPRY